MLVDEGLQDLMRSSSAWARAGQLRDLVGLAQFAHLSLQLFDALDFKRRDALTLAVIDLMLADSRRAAFAARSRSCWRWIRWQPTATDARDGAPAPSSRRSRTSGENFGDFLMAHSLELELLKTWAVLNRHTRPTLPGSPSSQISAFNFMAKGQVVMVRNLGTQPAQFTPHGSTAPFRPVLERLASF